MGTRLNVHYKFADPPQPAGTRLGDVVTGGDTSKFFILPLIFQENDRFYGYGYMGKVIEKRLLYHISTITSHLTLLLKIRNSKFRFFEKEKKSDF